MTAPHGLRVEHLDVALGIATPAPRLSWQLPAGAARQQAYRLTTDNGWDTGWVGSAEQVLVPYAGPPLASSQRVVWQVQVRTELGESPAAASWFETGLLWAEDWVAAWVEPGAMPEGPAGDRPAAFLRYAFDVEQPVVAARLHATAQGIYEASLDGVRIGDAELTPGYTQYDVRLQVQTHDLGPLAPGAHALGVVLADGWFRGQVGVLRHADQWGDRTALLAQLHLTHDDGTTTVLGTGPGWRSGTGHVLAADLIAGERWDLARHPAGWDTPGFDDGGWDPVTVVDHGYAGLVDSPAPPVRRVEELVPRSVTRLPGGAFVVDLGQNINGWLRLTDLGPAGTELTVTHGEWPAPDGDVTVANLEPDLPFLPHPLPAGQVDAVVSSGTPGEVFEPRRTTHGFRYARIEGHPGPLGADDVRGVVVHTDLRRTGWFSCSDRRIEALHEAAVWSFRDNACDIPTDCPHRERHGWTGDWQLFAPTAAFLFDVAGFSTKWLRDVAADQWPDGTVANISPCPRSEGAGSPIAFLNGSAGWGDACVLVPWATYLAYGDTGVLRENWPTMVAWLDRAETMAREQRHPARTGEPAPHERFLWDTGFHWGEWLEPGSHVGDLGAFAALDKGDVATAFLAHSAGLAARIAVIIGEDGERWATLAAGARDAWQREYVGDGRLTVDTQATHVRALAFDLVPAELRPAVAARLVELVGAAGGHLGTGFLATPHLLPVLADAGHLDTAYAVLLADGEPGWMRMVASGSTTVWERWDGVDAGGVPHDSLNHYSKGAVVSFLHRYTAGIELLEPGHRRFRVAPRPGGGLTSATAAHECPYGRIESAWSLSGGRFELRVVVPAGTSAEVVLPDGTTATAGPGTHTYDCEDSSR